MASTSIGLCSQATVMLGEGTIQSFDAETDGDAGVICGTLYETNVLGWLSVYPWSFCKLKVKLARNTTAPISGWKYSFQLPTDRLTPTYAVFPTDAVNARPTQSYAVQGDKILANYENIWLDYLGRPDESKWPPYFNLFMINALAFLFALPITQDKSLADAYREVAFGLPSDNGRGGLFGIAMTADSQAQPSQVIEQSPLVDARLS